MLRVLFLLVTVHFLADFGLQSDFMAKFKVPKSAPFWFEVLLAHSAIHGLGAFLATGSVLIGTLEVLAHCSIDYLKGLGRLSFRQDQLLHLLCKGAWLALFAAGL